MSATTTISATRKKVDSKLNVAIKVKRFLVLGGPSDEVKCNRYFNYAVGEFVRIANRLKVLAGEQIQLNFNEEETEMTASRGSQVFKIKKV
jgi:hypothetical protein